MTPKRLSKIHRALAKIALECAWLDYGEERALSEEFDGERRIVVEGGHRGYLILPTQGDPNHLGSSIRLVHACRAGDGRPYLGIVANILGVWLSTDTLKVAPAERVPADFASVHFF